MEIIKIGTINDSKVYAHAQHTDDGDIVLIPLGPVDRKFLSTDYCILCDSGVYPGVTDVDAHVCVLAQDKLRGYPIPLWKRRSAAKKAAN